MTAAKDMDVIARLPGCDGQAADAVSAYTQVKLEDAPRLLRISKSECPDVWIRRPRHKWTKSWGKIEDPVVHLERILHCHPSVGLFWERQFGGALLELGRVKIPNWECMFIENKDYSYQYTWTTEMDGQKQHMAPMRKTLMKHVDIDEPTSLLDHVYLGCTQRECKPNDTIIEQNTKLFE